MGAHLRHVAVVGRQFSHRIDEVVVGRDLYDVTMLVTYRDDINWSIKVTRFAPSYELTEAAATLDQIERVLDAWRHQDNIHDAVIERLRDDDEEAADYGYAVPRRTFYMRGSYL